jgi:hypothetical protein
MLELSAPYLAAAALIGGMFFLARRNQKQGWRRHRYEWWQAQSAAAAASFAAKSNPTLEHFSDLARLQQALVDENQTAQKEHFVETR